jgi:hypothetical protein
MTKPNAAIMVETHFELDIIAIEVDNWMAFIQVLAEDVLIDGRACEHYNKKPQNKIRFTQTKTNSIPPQNGTSEYD